MLDAAGAGCSGGKEGGTLIRKVESAEGGGEKERMENMKDVLFRNAARAWEEWTTSQNCSAIPTVRKQIYKHRCAALIQVIQEAGIADEYEKWREKHK